MIDWRTFSAVTGIAWPALPGPAGSALLSLLFQLEQTQWLDAQTLAERQRGQLDNLLRHAHATTPYYASRWRGVYDPAQPLSQEGFRRLPVLTRRDLQDSFEALKTHALPVAQGLAGEARSSGSTGTPVRVMKTQFNLQLWAAMTLRDHLWFGRELRAKLGVIRHGVTRGERQSWGSPTDGVFVTGPAAILDIKADVATQLAWLVDQRPTYLLTYPSLAGELARLSITKGRKLAGLREVRTMGEVLPPEVRTLCREAWGVPVADAYSAEETGYLALQCPEHDHYHVQAENVLVEILDDAGLPCAPGITGRVVVSVLHSFAMPLVRYALGDYAEFGEPCPCGRGLPVLTRIVGRARNMLITARGERYWPFFGSRGMTEIAPVRQHQFVQKSFDLVEARLVCDAPLTQAQEAVLIERIRVRLPDGFRVEIAYANEIPRSRGGKFEDFVSEVAPIPAAQ
jgi:phenylacetate-CoA ligase